MAPGAAAAIPPFTGSTASRSRSPGEKRSRSANAPAPNPPSRAASAASERRLAAFLDQLAGWQRPDDRTLILTAKDGTRATLTRPVEPHPEIAGRWIIESIGGKPLVTERRPPP